MRPVEELPEDGIPASVHQCTVWAQPRQLHMHVRDTKKGSERRSETLTGLPVLNEPFREFPAGFACCAILLLGLPLHSPPLHRQRAELSA